MKDEHPLVWEQIIVNYSTDGSFTTAISNSFSSPFQKAADLIVVGIISGDFLFTLIMVCCVYSLESP